MKQEKTALQRAGGFLLDMIFPKGIYCIACGTPLKGGDPDSLCEDCRKALLVQRPSVCRRCGRFARRPAQDFCEHCAGREPVYDRGVAAVEYKGPVRSILYGIKYDGKGYLAENMAAILLPLLPAPAWYDVIVPVPMHPGKRSERGYCQTTLLARHLARETGKPLITDGLIRIRKTRPMSELPHEQRAVNIRGAFQVPDPEVFAGKRILLVDDLLTTGSTADECARVLKEAGARSVYLAVFAAAVKEAVRKTES